MAQWERRGRGGEETGKGQDGGRDVGRRKGRRGKGIDDANIQGAIWGAFILMSSFFNARLQRKRGYDAMACTSHEDGTCMCQKQTPLPTPMFAPAGHNAGGYLIP